MKAEIPTADENPDECLNTIGKHMFHQFSRQDEFEGIMLTFVNNQERRIQELKTQLKNTQDMFMELAEKFIARIKEKIREEASHKKIEKIFELPVPNEPYHEWDDETPLPEPSLLKPSYPFESPREKKNSHDHSIFVGSMVVTLPNFHEARKRSFGFKPGVRRTQLKHTLISKTPWKSSPHSLNTCHDGNWNLNETSTDPFQHFTTSRDSNKTFDPGGTC